MGEGAWESSEVVTNCDHHAGDKLFGHATPDDFGDRLCRVSKWWIGSFIEAIIDIQQYFKCFVLVLIKYWN
jgi:hypothetical protein